MRLRALAVAAALAVVATAWPALTSSADATPSCDGVWVVVDPGDLGGSTSTRCASFSSGAYPVTGQQVLQAGGHSLTFVASTGFLCRIDRAPASDTCTRTPPANAYWSYWVADAGGSWRLSQQGATTSRRQASQVDGWVFGDGSRAPRAAPPAPPPPEPEPEPEPTPEPEPEPAPEPTPDPEPAPSSGGSSTGSTGSAATSGSAGSGSPDDAEGAADAGEGSSTTQGPEPDEAPSDEADDAADDNARDQVADPPGDGPDDELSVDEPDDSSDATEPEPEDDAPSEAMDADTAAAEDGRAPWGLLLGVLLIVGLIGLAGFESRRRRAEG